MVFRFDFTLYPWKHGGHLFHRSSNSFPVISASEEVRDLLSAKIVGLYGHAGLYRTLVNALQLYKIKLIMLTY